MFVYLLMYISSQFQKQMKWFTKNTYKERFS